MHVANAYFPQVISELREKLDLQHFILPVWLHASQSKLKNKGRIRYKLIDSYHPFSHIGKGSFLAFIL